MTDAESVSGSDLLTPLSLRYVLELDDEKRINHLRQGFWIDHAGANEIIEHLHLIHQGKLDDNPYCPRNVLVLAEAGVGKTVTVNEFSSNYSVARDSSGMIQTPILSAKANTLGSLDNFYSEILRRYKPPEGPNRGSRYEQFLNLLGNSGVRTLVIDEFNEVQFAKPQERDQFVHQVCKHLPDELGIHIVAVGTPDAEHLLGIDDQLYDRYDILELEPWSISTEGQREAFEEFLNTYEALLPLHKPSGLSQDQLLTEIFSLTGGINRRLARLLFLGCEVAIKSGEERITIEILNVAKSKKSFRAPDQDRVVRRSNHAS